MTAVIAPQLDGEFASGVAFYTERLDSDAPYSDRATADRAAQAEALRLVLAEVDVQEVGAPGSITFGYAVAAIKRVARELGVEL